MADASFLLLAFLVRLAAPYAGAAGEESPLAGQTLNVTTMLFPPLVMRDSPSSPVEGFCIDLLRDLGERLNFSFSLTVLDDEFPKEPLQGRIKRLIQRLVENETDLAVTGLSVTKERQGILDFSVPFLSSGVGALYIEPAYDEPPWYAFARPLTWRVWLCVLGLYVLGSLTLFAASRVSPYERRKGEPTSLGGCFWFMLSSFFLRGATQGPQAWSCRLVAVIWWWFSVLLLFLYVHVVALSYATQETTPPIRAVEDLARQSVVQYGAVGGGATHAFFKNAKVSIYSHLHDVMEAHPENLLRDYEEGVARVKSSNGEFAFFMETLSMEYYLSRHCDLAQLGKTVNRISYAVAFPKGSWLMPLMSSALLEMQEDGSLWGLDLKWFHFRNDCREEPGRSPGLTHIDLYNFGGIVFVVLLGLILAILVAFFELCVYSVATVKKGGKTAHTSVRRQMKEEFRESLRLNPPKRPPPPPPVEEMG